MQNKCPFFGKCGGCIYDFNAPDYRAQKLQHVEKLKPTNEPVWIDAGNRRRADFCFAPNQFGLFEAKSKNIINITHCPNLRPEINAILPQLASMPHRMQVYLLCRCLLFLMPTLPSDLPTSRRTSNARLKRPMKS